MTFFSIAVLLEAWSMIWEHFPYPQAVPFIKMLLLLLVVQLAIYKLLGTAHKDKKNID